MRRRRARPEGREGALATLAFLQRSLPVLDDGEARHDRVHHRCIKRLPALLLEGKAVHKLEPLTNREHPRLLARPSRHELAEPPGGRKGAILRGGPLREQRPILQELLLVRQQRREELRDGLRRPARLLDEHNWRATLDRLGYHLNGALTAGQHEQHLWDAHVVGEALLQLRPEPDLPAEARRLVIVNQQKMRVVRVEGGRHCRVCSHLSIADGALSGARSVELVLARYAPKWRDPDARRQLSSGRGVFGDRCARQSHHPAVGTARDDPCVGRARRLGEPSLEEKLEVRLESHVLGRPCD